MLSLCLPLAAAAQEDPGALARINALIQQQGRARVIVELRLPGGAHVPEGRLSSAAATVQRQDIATVGGAVSSRIKPTGSKLIRRYDSLPYMALDVDAAGLAQLKAAGLHVARIFEDKRLSPALYQSGPFVQADQTAAQGFDGSGWVVAIVDDGVDKTHPFLAGKVISEACFVAGNGCPNGLDSQTGSGAATPFPGSTHGTHIAGIAAGNGPNAVPPPSPMMSGMARGAQIIAIDVFGPYDGALVSDVIAGLNQVFFLRSTLNIASVNLSLGIPDEAHTVACDDTDAPIKSAIDQLRSVNIATVIASGDDGFTSAISSPSCVSSSISVGSTTKSDVVSSFSNVSSLLSLNAPGSSIYSSLTGGGYAFFDGTSMSAPHVAGAWAVLRQANPTATVSQVLGALQSSGVPIVDGRPGGSVTKPRILIKNAMALLAPTPTSVAPPSGVLGTSLTATILGSNFTSGSTVGFGAGITVNSTTFVSSTQLTVGITIAASASPGKHTITVTNSDGSVGNFLDAFTVTLPPPTITSLSPSTASGFGPAFTLTVNGTNFVSSSVVQVNGSSRATTFVSSTKLTAVVPATDLATPASSLAITVDTPVLGGGTSAPSSLTLSQPSLSVSAATSPPGGSITATLSNGLGGSTDWLALAPAGAATTSYLQWTYVGAGVTTRTWTVTMPTTLGSYEFRLYLNNGYTVAATSPAVAVANINPTPSITALSPAGVAAGSSGFTLTVTGAGFVSGATATVGGQARSVTFVSGTQVSIAVLAADVAVAGPFPVAIPVLVTNPAACVSGQCASNTVSFNATAPPPAPTLASLSPASVGVGGPAFTLTATGANFAGNSVVRVNGSNRPSTYVSPTQLTASIPASDLATAGALSITVFTPAPGGGTSTTQSLTVVGPSLAVSGTTSLPGGSITATLSNGPGGSSDWLALAQVGTPATSYLQWTYVGAGVTTRTWTVTMPSTVGNYEFRLYLNNGYTVAATSPAVAVANINATPSITALSPAGVAAGASGFTLTVTGTGFAPGATATVGGVARTLTFVSATQVSLAVLAADVAVGGPFPVGIAVQVTNPAACVGGQCASNTVSFNVTAPPPPPTLTSLSPTSAGVGGPAFTLTVTGADFAGNSMVRVNGSPRSTTYVSPTQLTASIPASDLVTAGALSITVFTPAPGGGTSATQSLTVVGPGLAVSGTTSLPGGSITMTLSNGPGGSSDWLALAQAGTPATSYLQWTYVGAGVTTRTWTVTMPTTVGSYEFRLYLNNGYTVAATSPAVAVANINATPSITGLNPASVAAGAGGFTLTLTGTGFVSGTTATVAGQARSVTFLSGTQVTVAVTTADVASQGPVGVQVSNPAPCVSGQCTSNTVNLAVTAPPPAPTLASLNPTSAGVGGPALTLTVTGTDFAGNSVVRVNGAPRPTSYVSPTQLTASIPASDLASAGTLSVTVFTPAPGGGPSNVLFLPVIGPGLTVSGTTSLPGGSITATLSNGPGGSGDWLALAQVGTPATSYLQWTYVGAGVTTRTWTVTMPSTVGSYEFRLYLNNSYTVAATSPAVTVANINATPSITALSPAGVAAGASGFTLTITGTGFAVGATATVGGVARTLTFVSATQVSITVLAADVAVGGPFPVGIPVQVTNPAACVGGQCASNTASLTVTAPPPVPTLTSLSPTSAGAGGPAFTLTVMGADFAGNSVVRVNGSPRATTYVSPTQLTATIPASDLAAAGTLSVTVFTPAPGGGPSNVLLLPVIGPGLAVSPAAALGLQSVTSTLSNSPGNPTDWLALAVAGSPDTSYLQWTYVGAGVTNRTWAPTMPNAGGSYEFRLYLNNSYTVAARSPVVVVTQDLRGTYAVSFSLTQSGCSNPGNNGTFGGSGTLSITSQLGGSFLGTALLNTSTAGLPIQTTITITSGTVTPPATPPTSTVNAVVTFATAVLSTPLMSGSGTLVGTSVPNQIAVNVSAQATSGETCQINGPVSATK